MTARGLRIIAGEFRGRKLRTIERPGTRPMTDRVRENLFNILGPELQGARFLDLFAGSGAVGIEALSRGAESTTFVELDRQWSDVVEANLRMLNLADRAENLRGDVYKIVRRLGNDGARFDIIFMGAPYDGVHHNRAGGAVIDAGILADKGTMVLQYRKGDPLDTFEGYDVDTRKYGITNLTFVRKQQ